MLVNEKKKLKWAILSTGWGNNACDVIKASSITPFKNSKISLVIYEQTPCGAAQMAKQYGIETLQISRSQYSKSATYQLKLIEEIKKRQIDYIFLMNYKYLIKNEMLQAFPNKIINVHPSLFPSFLGTKTAIQDALEYGVKITGITTHIIDGQYDRGVILCQEPIRIAPKDNFETLYPNFRKKGLKIIMETIKLIEKKDNKFSKN